MVRKSVELRIHKHWRLKSKWLKNSYSHITSHLWNKLSAEAYAAPNIKTFHRILNNAHGRGKQF